MRETFWGGTGDKKLEDWWFFVFLPLLSTAHLESFKTSSSDPSCLYDCVFQFPCNLLPAELCTGMVK